MTAPTTGTALNTSELRAMLAAATPGPWRTFPDAEGGVWARDGYGMAATGCGQKNGDLIAAAVNNLEALLDAADRLAAVEETVRVLLRFDCEEDYIPPAIDVPDDYEAGVIDAAASVRAALATDTTTEDS